MIISRRVVRVCRVAGPTRSARITAGHITGAGFLSCLGTDGPQPKAVVGKAMAAVAGLLKGGLGCHWLWV